MGSYRLIEHTADMGIEATAATLEDLFAQAAYALIEIIFGEQRDIRCVQEKSITTEGSDHGELLVNFLNEVIYLVEFQELLPADIEVEDVGENQVKARLSGDLYTHGRHERLEREVKAVTYHQLMVEKTNGGWQARVFVDL